MNYLAQLYGNLGAQQYQPLSTNWLSQFSAPSAQGSGQVVGGGGWSPSISGGNYSLSPPPMANTNWLGGLNQAWNSPGGRSLSSVLGLGTLRAGSNFLEGLTAANGGLGTGLQNVFSQMFGGGPAQAVQDQRGFDADVAAESQAMIDRGINPDTGLPFNQAQADAQRQQRNAGRRAALGSNATINREIAAAAREAAIMQAISTRGGTEVQR